MGRISNAVKAARKAKADQHYAEAKLVCERVLSQCNNWTEVSFAAHQLARQMNMGTPEHTASSLLMIEGRKKFPN